MTLKRTNTVDGVITVGEEELRNLLHRYLYSYRFHFSGVMPKRIVIPMFNTVGGVDITYEPAEVADPPEKDSKEKVVAPKPNSISGTQEEVEDAISG